MAQKKGKGDKPENLSKLESEVAKTNPDFVKWLRTRKAKAAAPK